MLENPNYTVDPRIDCREFDLLTVYFIDRGGLRLFDGADSSNVLYNKQCYTMLFSNSFVTSIDAQWISLGKYILGIRVCVCVCLFVLYPGAYQNGQHRRRHFFSPITCFCNRRSRNRHFVY